MNKKFPALLSAIMLLGLPLAVAAASDPTTWIQDILNKFLTMIVWPVFIGVVIIMFIWSGFLFLTAQSDPGKRSAAIRAFLFAIIGVVVAILAFSVYDIISNVVVAVPSIKCEDSAPPFCNGECAGGAHCSSSSGSGGCVCAS